MSSGKGDIELGTVPFNNQLALKIKTATGSGEIEILTTQNETVGDLKNKISSKLSLGFDKHLRLIFSGKLLDPPSTKLSEFKLQNGSFIHAVVSNKLVTRSPRSTTASGGTVSNLPFPPAVSLPLYRGLDTLLTINNRNGRPMIGPDDVAQLRAHFATAIREYGEQYLVQIPTESPLSYHLRCESQWMAAQDSGSELHHRLIAYRMFGSTAGPIRNTNDTTNTTTSEANEINTNNTETNDLSDNENENDPLLLGDNDGGDGFDNDEYQAAAGIYGAATEQDLGTTKDFVWGMTLGFLLGFMMIFCIWDRNVTQKQKMGILVGIVLQGFFAAPRSVDHSKDHTRGGNLRGGDHTPLDTTPLHGNNNDDQVGIAQFVPGSVER